MFPVSIDLSSFPSSSLGTHTLEAPLPGLRACIVYLLSADEGRKLPTLERAHYQDAEAELRGRRTQAGASGTTEKLSYTTLRVVI